VRNQLVEKYRDSHEIQELVRQINIEDLNTVQKLGEDATRELSEFADKILHTIQNSKIEDSGVVLSQLTEIMKKFDIKDFEEPKKGFLAKFLGKVQQSIEEFYSKYQTMGGEVDKIYIAIKQYENEINSANRTYTELFNRNQVCYEELGKRILAGEYMVSKLEKEIIPEFESVALSSGSDMDRLRYENVVQGKNFLEQRVYDLKLAENIAIHTMMSIRENQKSNYYMLRKIDSAFVITLPIFKNCLIQAIMSKRQAVITKSMEALDNATNELILRNAHNTAEQSKKIATMALGSSVSVETLETAFNTIVAGIEETKRIEIEAKAKRLDGAQRLANLKQDYDKRKLNSH